MGHTVIIDPKFSVFVFLKPPCLKKRNQSNLGQLSLFVLRVFDSTFSLLRYFLIYHSIVKIILLIFRSPGSRLPPIQQPPRDRNDVLGLPNALPPTIQEQPRPQRRPLRPSTGNGRPLGKEFCTTFCFAYTMYTYLGSFILIVIQD